MGYFFAFICMILFYGVILCTIVLTSTWKQIISELTKRDIVILICTGIIFWCLITALIVREKFVYFWDYGAYWYKTLDYSNQLFSDPISAIKLLVTSLNYDEYNNLLCMIIAIPLKFFGGSYVAFILLNIAMFYIPNAMLMAYLIYIVNNRYSLKKYNIIWLFLYTITFSAALFPVLDGYIDIAGMLPLTAGYILIIDRDFSKCEIVKDFSLGICVLLTIFSRRYLAYAVVGISLFGAIIWLFEGFFVMIKSNHINTQTCFKMRLCDICVSLSIPIILLFTVFNDFLVRSVFNNYVVAYSAYKSTNLLGEWIRFIQWFGGINIILLLLGIISNFRKQVLCFTNALCLNIVLSCLLFFRIQDMGEQHYYIIIVPTVCLIFSGIDFIVTLFKKKILLILSVSLLSVMMATNFILSLGIDSVGIRSLGGGYAWTGYRYTPKIRYDMDTLSQLVNFLGELSSEGYQKVYCLGSSGIINNDILKKLNAPDFNLPFICMDVSQVDLRDGFYTNFFEADVILACNPEQYHLSSGQELIRQLNDIFLTENEFSRNYKCVKSFLLDQNVEILVFVKEKKLERSDIEFIQRVSNDLYPNYPEIFDDRINSYLKQYY